ncbi:hypothetical protein GAYE_SCF07G2950 [Galdieria yellowstonensis]|uniref:COP9 signalosome complex subunit 2 n=1 Tax=Galdieria yellowstonensis TaxID=3028027 RepID=A0AAV9IC67_9RHOD|nr:hypothetical protein GAYE_SCF07G2950 [Galdieria yellowstonensis]
MSDEEYEDYGFEYSEEESEEEDVDIENQYYNSKALIESNPEEALQGFEQVLAMESHKGEWGFKALKQIVKLLFKHGRYDEMLKRYRELLTYIQSAVTRNYSEKSINKILDYVSSSQQLNLLQEFYECTLEALQHAMNERLWFKTKLKLGKLYFDLGEYGRLSKVIRELHQSCRKEDGTEDQKKGTQLLEIYALEIQLYTATKNSKKLKQLYEQALQVKSAIPHPRIMGIIRECGGKMNVENKDFESAFSDFFEAFKNYDEAGSQRRIQCLKYLVLANMLSLSEINPFDSPEAKPYVDNPEIIAMTSLVQAYAKKEIHEFERILEENKDKIMDDSFIRAHIQELLSRIRTQYLLKLIRPYTRIELAFIAKELNIPVADVESLLVLLILDEEIVGFIDQEQGTLELHHHHMNQERHDAVSKWSEELGHLLTAIESKLI